MSYILLYSLSLLFRSAIALNFSGYLLSCAFFVFLEDYLFLTLNGSQGSTLVLSTPEC